MNLHEVDFLNWLEWVKQVNRNFRVLYKHRDERNYSLIGAGTVLKLVGFKTAKEAFYKAMQSDEQIVSFDVKNVIRFKFYSK